MFGDEIKKLERRVDAELGNVTTFIQQLQDAKKNAQELDTHADKHMARLKKVKNDSATVVNFVDTLMKNVKTK